MSRRALAIALGVAISVVCLWLALRGTDFAEVGAALSKASFALAIPLLLAYVAFYWLKAWRWRLLLLPMKDAPTSRLVSPMMIGFMGNNILPAHLGEFVRMYLGARKLGLRKSQVLATIALERLFDFLSVVFFLGIALAFSDDVPRPLLVAGGITAVGGVVVLIAAAIYAARPGPFVRVVGQMLGPFPAKLRDGIVHRLETSAQALGAMRQPRLLAGIALTSIAQWGFMGLALYSALWSVDVDVSALAAFVVLAAVTFGVTLPAAPGFFGTIQLAFTMSLKPYGVDEGSALAASVFFHVLTYVAVTLLGLVLLRREGLRLGELEQVAHQTDDEEAARDSTSATAAADS